MSPGAAVRLSNSAVTVATVVTAVGVAVARGGHRSWFGCAMRPRRSMFAHMLDGVSTAVGADVSRITELTRAGGVFELAGTLPTAPYLGKGWLFVFVKLLVAIGVASCWMTILKKIPSKRASCSRS
ncbi:hypothetical protein C8039_17815 [Halogeometricum sp. wsp3]|nr:hypothetical protein C8039_17815 [Halogeometricum sp. wsp3]